MSDLKGSMDSLNVPPVRQFHPTDEELITQYLCRKMGDNSFSAAAIGEADLSRLDPWDFPGVSPWVFPGVSVQDGIREWFFFSPRISQEIYRATYSGCWKTTGEDIQIFEGKTLVGMEKTMVFWRNKLAQIWKTNWTMHEYRLEGSNEWVICKVFLENNMKISEKELRPRSMMYLSETTQSLAGNLIDSNVCFEVIYNNDSVMFVLPFATVDSLKAEVLKKYNELEGKTFKIEYPYEAGFALLLEIFQVHRSNASEIVCFQTFRRRRGIHGIIC